MSKSNQVLRHSAPKQLPDGNARTLHEVQKDQAGVAGLVFYTWVFYFCDDVVCRCILFSLLLIAFIATEFHTLYPF